MPKVNEAPWANIILWVRVVFAVHLIYTGLAYIIGGWEPKDMINAQHGAGSFMVELAQIGLYPYIKYLEFITGVMLILDFATPLALVLEFPITVTIFYLNFVLEGLGHSRPREIYTGLQELFLNGTLLLAYGGHYASMLKIKAKPWALWENLPATKVDNDAKIQAPMNTGLVLLLATIVILSGIVVFASLQGPPERRLPPRDYVPLIIACLFVGFNFFRTPKNQ